MRSILLVGLGGAAGSMLRYSISMLSGKLFQASFPIATLTVNLVGCLAIGLLAGTASRNEWFAGQGWLLLATGLCGGFTTFSAFALDNLKLLQQGANASAIIYMAVSIAGGILFTVAGYYLSR